MRRAALIFNPRAGSWRTSRRVAAIGEALSEIGYDVRPAPTQRPGHATELARRAATGGCEVVFSHGGDGTLREAAAGLIGTDCALAPIPGGTVNVVAMALGLPQDPLAAAARLASAEIAETDVGLCGEEVFLMQTSAGLDAHIMGRLNPVLKRRLGKAAVAWSALLNFTRYHYPTIDLSADGRRRSASMIAVCNLPYYGGAFKMAPEASTSDGWLDLVLFSGRGWSETLAFARDLARGRHLARNDVELVRVQEVELRGPSGLNVQLDGDTLPVQLPVTIGVHPQRLRLLKPVAR